MSRERYEWESSRSQDSRRRFESPSGTTPKPLMSGTNQNSPFKGYGSKPVDRDSTSNRKTRKQSNLYDFGLVDNLRNLHYYQPIHYHAASVPVRDNKDSRMNGPRQVINIHNSRVIVGTEIECPEFRPSPEVLAELEEQFLYPLKKKSLRFPKAKYFCRLCDYHCDSLLVCRRHIVDSRHKRVKEAKDLETTLKNLPPATDTHIAAIDKLITSVSEHMKATSELISTRRKVVSQFSDCLAAKVKGCKLEMVGSSISGFCLKTSDVNVDIVMDGNQNPSAALLGVRELVTNSDEYINVVDDLSSSFPTMSFTHSKTNQRLVVGASSGSSKQTNQLFQEYASLDHRVPILGVALRHWAKLCLIDDQSRGTLPAHSFTVMLIHFLQQHQPPVLPVLHMLHPVPDGDVYLRASEIHDKWKCRNTENVGKLWLEMFKFYTMDFKMSEEVINIRYLKPMNKSEKAWSKKIVIEDPFVQKRNLTRTVSGSPVIEYILDRFRTSYKYFAIPQLSYGPLFLHIIFKDVKPKIKESGNTSLKNMKGRVLLESIEKAGQTQSEASSECETERTEDESDDVMATDSQENETGSMSCFDADISSISLEETQEHACDSGRSTSADKKDKECENTFENLRRTLYFVIPRQAANLMNQVKEENLHYRFEERFFTLGQKPPLICGSCQKDGHCKADCHEDDLPPLKRLPSSTKHYLDLLTTIFEQLTRDFEPAVQEIMERDKIVSNLENYICQFFQGVSLQLFGSSANGFGFQRSDLDICLTFNGNPKGQNIDHIKIIESLAEKLKRYRQCGHVFAITTAKVPIVKFSIRQAFLEGDLSLYNTLALQNTKLLYTYSKVDPRVKCLGYAMKYFAKLCDIGDASRGSLSSYAYILMVLHFLQQCKPPVVPVLQELYDHSQPAPELLIDGWNAWFFDDIDELKNVWNDFGKNTDSVGKLWIAMLCYYTETFNWKDNVVSIRQLAPLTRLQKLWNSRCIAIEDPFDLSHNLGAGLSRKMNTYIMKAFIRGREVFGSAVLGYPLGYKNLVDYLFDSKQLTDGAPPNDRGCRFCGKIGHIQKDCPKKKINTEQRERENPKNHRVSVRSSGVKDIKEESRDSAESQRHQKEDTDTETKAKQKVIAAASKGRETPIRSFQDVTGSSPNQVSSEDRKVASSTKLKRQEQGKLPHRVPASLPRKEAKDSVISNALCNEPNKKSQDVKSEYMKQDDVDVQLHNTPLAVTHFKNNNSSESTTRKLIKESSKCFNRNVIDSSLNSMSGMQGATTVGKSNAILQDQTENMVKCGVPQGIPPGFHNFTHAEHSVAEKNPSHGIKSGTSEENNLIPITKMQISSNATHSNNSIPILLNVQPNEKNQVQQNMKIQQKPEKFSEGSSSQYVNIKSEADKSDKDKNKKCQVTTTASNQSSQEYQQQYPYSISPAALFHMASQAAGGQISAMMVRNPAESNSTSRPRKTPSTTATISTTTIGAPPGFSAPLPLSFPGQQMESVSMNKVMIGSSLYRPRVSQIGGQSATQSTVSQPFLSVSGPVPGMYVSAHTPHTYNNPSLNQRHPVFDTRHIISQQVTQGLHQNLTQGLPEGVTSSVPLGIQAGTSVSLPPPGIDVSLSQCINNSVPQAVPQGIHQNLQGGISQVNCSAVSQGMQPVPLGHHFPPQHTYNQQGYHMTVPGASGFYSEYVIGDPILQNNSTNSQGLPNISAELMQEIPFQQPDVYNHTLQAIPQYMSSSLPQHQSLINPMPQPHPSVALPPQRPPLPPESAPAAAYSQGSLIYIDSERKRNHMML